MPLTMGVRLFAIFSVIAMVRNCNNRPLNSPPAVAHGIYLTGFITEVYVEELGAKNLTLSHQPWLVRFKRCPNSLRRIESHLRPLGRVLQLVVGEALAAIEATL